VRNLQWTNPHEVLHRNGKQFISKVFKAVAHKNGIKLIFGRPYNPRGRGKIKRYYQTLYRELIALKDFRSLIHFRRELWNFDQRYNYWRKQEILDWMTPPQSITTKSISIKNRKYLKSGHKLCQQTGH
jgi:putative transposase